ncbi:hypothetical protein PR003_g20359 [Phytophthora rubi]|uniref:Uncharacterized protein n=1 Tax=Phytophthora rubi TaxID=129364 RepID=A0A6A4DNQ4_9STRA|nr:hypothetical protein PR002_g19774 [Phytophthora rubi]KAE8998637.1 hypothetical protein PR001_g19272 [Phytophthora rubi]KAE9310032.1 hypothetical protein PR003_g20359 [Phytophthora rubi]
MAGSEKCWSSCDSTRRTCISKHLAAMGLRDVLECINALCYLDHEALESTDRNELADSEVDKWWRLLGLGHGCLDVTHACYAARSCDHGLNLQRVLIAHLHHARERHFRTGGLDERLQRL